MTIRPDSDVLIRAELQGSAAEAVLDQYDIDTSTWNMPKKGGFWSSIDVAHRAGRMGEGTSIAVLDGPLDYSYPALSAVVSQTPFNGGSMAHGTSVALLIRDVAPRSELRWYPVANGRDVLAKHWRSSIDSLRNDPPDVLNLSLSDALSRADSSRLHGTEALGWYESGEAPDRCPSGLCLDARSIAAIGETTIIGAVGNENGVHCPARDPSVLACGFIVERRESRPSEDGSDYEHVEILETSYEQSSLPSYALLQPEGVLGSSFSAPLVAAAVLLMENRDHLPGFINGAIATASIMANATMQPPKTNRDAEGIVNSLLRVLQGMPHRHSPLAREACFECGLFAEPTWVEIGRYLANMGEAETAESVLRQATALFPWSPDAHANMGAVLMHARAHDRASLQEARAHYETAISVRPNSRTYQNQIEHLSGLLE